MQGCRHDFARCVPPGSVRVPALPEMHIHANHEVPRTFPPCAPTSPAAVPLSSKSQSAATAGASAENLYYINTSACLERLGEEAVSSVRCGQGSHVHLARRRVRWGLTAVKTLSNINSCHRRGQSPRDILAGDTDGG